MAKISVVIPVYNVEKYLSECIESILTQTLSDMEIICVNDGSTDSSPAILERYAARDSRIKLISKPNSGYGNTINVGFAAATGEYLGIVESDDVVAPEMFEELVRTADENRCDIVKADFYTFVDCGEDRIFTRRRLAETVKKPSRFYGRALCPLYEPECFKLLMNTWAGIYRRQLIEDNAIKLNESPGASFQDNGLWFKSFAFAQRVMFVEKPYYMLRRDNTSSSVHDKNNKVYALCSEYDHIYDFLKSEPKLFPQLIGYFWLKKYHNYAWSYDERIAPEYREEFLMRFSEEFRTARSRGELDLSIFAPREAARLERIVNNPRTFHSEETPFLALRDETAKGGSGTDFALKRLKLCVHDHGYAGTAAVIAGKLLGKLKAKR